MTEQHISDRLESFFKNIEGEPKPQSSSGFNEFTTAARAELEKVHGEIGDEDYNKFAELAAKDERINAHLPGLAIVALSPQTNAFNRFIDPDRSGSVSKSELNEAANNSAKFDPIHRKALQYAADNFDKLRALNPKDGSIIGNNSELTTADIHVAKQNFSNYRERRAALKDMRLVLDNFETIDRNDSGKITQSELKKWSEEKGIILNYFARLQPTARAIGGSEELTRPEYTSRMVEHERTLNEISTQLGLK